MDKLLNSGNKYWIGGPIDSHEKLPEGVYTLQCDKVRGFELERTANFKLPKKMYGDYMEVDRWLTSWAHTENNLGIVLSGLKGTGKTLIAKYLCVKSKCPVIIVGAGYGGPEFTSFLSNPLFSGSIVLVDEFEKIYPTSRWSSEEGENIPVDPTDFLQLMSGAFTTHLMFVLTMNKFQISDLLVNRLERIKYRKHFDSLDKIVVDEVITDILKNKEHADSIYKFFNKLGTCSYDLLVNLIGEMNLFREDAIACGKYLNLKCEDTYYEAFELIDDKEIECHNTSFAKDQESINIYRKLEDKEYPTDEKKYKNSLVQLKLAECEIEETEDYKTFLVIDKKRKLKFRFTEKNHYSMVF